ncbi:hypothetical protein EJ02DRAFT_442619 [Clathrospora elynae]|uniref:Rhodopsin domain-containing protein n=1 Tax=Clathrospora elynae TaxID=706981 RepID=A0A6A5T0S7_9PLEO|nr:hypothetical protein EJ02DRAFT_442619 [Clathrospora elynae]
MADEFTTIIGGMMQSPPNPNEPIPFTNHLGTMYGVSIPFHVLSWIFVAFRLHTRLRVVREPGLDDLFVVLAALFNLVSLITFLKSTKHGMGQHLIYILPELQQTMLWLYMTNAAYHTTTALIKVSLLLQYLRLFREGSRRIVCIVLLLLVVSWGIAFSFMAWVPCFPVRGFWDRTLDPPAKCYGFGYRGVNEAKHTVLAFAASNMTLDIAILLIPLTEYFRQDLRRKQLFAMTGLFALGLIVVLMATFRLWSIFKHNQNLTQSFDFTWWYPEVLIFSCLEVDFAIMCASVPIFWPTVVASCSHIFVTSEVRISHHQRLNNNSRDEFEMLRTHSMKSTASTEGLNSTASLEQKSFYNGYDTETGRDRRIETTKVQVQPYAQPPRTL